MAKGRIQNRHGTYAQFSEASSPLLSEEVGIIDSGHPDTPSGKAVYYQPASGDPVRLANAEELVKIYRINEDIVPESANWYDLQGNPHIPSDFEGFTGEAPELVFWEEETSIWLLTNVVYNSQTGQYSYIWAQMLTTEEV